MPLIDMAEVESGQIPLVVDVRPAEDWQQDRVTGSLSLPVTSEEKEEDGGQTELVRTVCRLLGPRLSDLPGQPGPVLVVGGADPGPARLAAILLQLAGWTPSLLRGGFPAYRDQVMVRQYPHFSPLQTKALSCFT